MEDRSVDVEEPRKALVEALGNPLRAQIYITVADRPGATIAQVATRIRESPRRVRHQMDRLRLAGLVSVDSESARRNARERHYRAILPPEVREQADDSWTDDDRRRLAVSVAKMMVSDIVRASQNRTFGIHAGHAEVRIPGEVDPSGWDEISKIMVKSTEEIERAMERSALRLRAAGDSGVEMIAGLLFFEAPSWGASPDDPPGPRPTIWLDPEPSGTNG